MTDTKFVFMIERHIRSDEQIRYVIFVYPVIEETEKEYIVVGTTNLIRKIVKSSWQTFTSYAEASAYAEECGRTK